MQIQEFSGEEFEYVIGEYFIPAIARMGPEYRGRVAVQELGETVALSRSHWGPMSAVRTGRMAARASADTLMLFCIWLGGAASTSTTASRNWRTVREF